MPLHIRPARHQDAPALDALLRAIGWFAHMQEPPEATLPSITRHLAFCLADTSHSLYVAETAQGDLQGYIAAHWLPYLFLPGPEGYISELFIHPSARGQHIGTHLLDTILQEAQTRGCYRLQLINMRHRESYQRGFYAKHGWEERPDAADFIYLVPPPASTDPRTPTNTL